MPWRKQFFSDCHCSSQISVYLEKEDVARSNFCSRIDTGHANSGQNGRCFSLKSLCTRLNPWRKHSMHSRKRRWKESFKEVSWQRCSFCCRKFPLEHNAVVVSASCGLESWAETKTGRSTSDRTEKSQWQEKLKKEWLLAGILNSNQPQSNAWRTFKELKELRNKGMKFIKCRNGFFFRWCSFMQLHTKRFSLISGWMREW